MPFFFFPSFTRWFPKVLSSGKCTHPDKGQNFWTATKKNTYKLQFGDQAPHLMWWLWPWTHSGWWRPSRPCFGWKEGPQPVKWLGEEKRLGCWPYMTTEQIWLGREWSPEGGHVEPVSLGARGLQSETPSLGWDASWGYCPGWELSAFRWVICVSWVIISKCFVSIWLFILSQLLQVTWQPTIFSLFSFLLRCLLWHPPVLVGLLWVFWMF